MPVEHGRGHYVIRQREVAPEQQTVGSVEGQYAVLIGSIDRVLQISEVGIEVVQVAAWADVAGTLRSFETVTGFEAPAEVLVAAGTKPI